MPVVVVVAEAEAEAEDGIESGELVAEDKEDEEDEMDEEDEEQEVEEDEAALSPLAVSPPPTACSNALVSSTSFKR